MFFVLAFSHNVFYKKVKITTYCTSKDSCQNHFQPYEHVSGVGEMLFPLENKPYEPLKSRVLRICKKKTTVYNYNVLLPGYGRTHSPISLLPPC